MIRAAGSAGRLPLVGRARELSILLEQLEEARGGRGRAVLIGGEPGIGKTRLVAELADRATAGGVRVLAARAVESEGQPPYSLFADLLRDYLNADSVIVAEVAAGLGAAQVVRLLPELRDRFPPTVERQPVAELGEQEWLFQGITQFLAAAGRAQPGLVLLLDDLHWADAPSLQLLRYVVQRLEESSLLLLGTYRDVEVDAEHPLTGVLSESLRRWSGVQLHLQGLSEPETSRYVALNASTPIAEALSARLHQAARGNPLFVVELLRLLSTEGRLASPAGEREWLPAVPRSIEHIIGRRLDRLTEGCLRLLTFASVLGAEFDLPALTHVGIEDAAEREELLGALEEAEAARLVAALGGPSGRYAFSHPLVRETLYRQLLTRERARLHRRAGEALEQMYAGDLEPHVAELAGHFMLAAPAGGAEKAMQFARRAAARSAALFAYEEAARWCTAALGVMGFSALDAAAQKLLRCELMLALGEAESRAGETPAARSTFLRTCQLARELGHAELFARSALGYGGYRGTPGLLDSVLVGLLDEAAALGEQGDTSDALRARVLARLAMELYSGGDRERREQLSEAAIAIGRRSGDRAALASALVGRHYALHGPENTVERLAAAEELVALAEAAGELELALQGHYLRVIDALELANMPAVEASIAAHVRLSQEVRQPLYLWRSDLLLGMRSMLEGRLEEAESLINRAWDVSRRAQIANSLVAYGTQLILLRMETGGLAALEEGQRRTAEQYPSIVAYRVGLAMIYRLQQQEAAARIELERLAPGDFAVIIPDDNFFTCMAAMADVCAFLNDAARASSLYDRLLPYSGRVVVVNAAIACMGAVDRYLGLLATVLERWDDASRHFEAALARNASLGSRPQVAHTQHELAQMLLRRAAPEDRTHAEALLAQAEATALALGMPLLLAEIQRLRGSTAVPAARMTPASPAGLSGRELEVLRLLAAGHTNQEIADALVLSSRTVDHHIQAIYRKTGVRRRVDAVAFALRAGLTTPE